MIIGKNLVSEIFKDDPRLGLGGGARQVNTDRFPESNLVNESAAASLFIEFDAGASVNVAPYPTAAFLERGAADFIGLRPHPILGYDKKLLDGTVTVDFYFFPDGATERIEFGRYDIFKEPRGQQAWFRVTNPTAEKQVVRFDDLFAFQDIDLGRNINRGFDLINVQRSRTEKNEFGHSITIERNTTREINVRLSLLSAEQKEKLRVFLSERKQEPFMTIPDPKSASTDREALWGKFNVEGNITSRHTFGRFWESRFRIREVV